MAVEKLLASLARVDAERATRLSDPSLGQRVVALKAFQQGRLGLTYPDLLVHPRWSGAARFFLDELYGPSDFSERDRGLARVVPTLVRLFPSEVVETVDRLLRLHAVSEELDTAMARMDGSGTDGPALLAPAPASTPKVSGPGFERPGGARQAVSVWTGDRYGEVWRAVGRRGDREEQVRTVVEIGQQLDRLTRLPGLRQSLRLMRLPASVAGLGVLQGFLERGFDAFRAMNGAAGFLQTIETRETLWLEFLFEHRAPDPQDPGWLGQFP